MIEFACFLLCAYLNQVESLLLINTVNKLGSKHGRSHYHRTCCRSSPVTTMRETFNPHPPTHRNEFQISMLPGGGEFDPMVGSNASPLMMMTTSTMNGSGGGGMLNMPPMAMTSPPAPPPYYPHHQQQQHPASLANCRPGTQFFGPGGGGIPINAATTTMSHLMNGGGGGTSPMIGLPTPDPQMGLLNNNTMLDGAAGGTPVATAPVAAAAGKQQGTNSASKASKPKRARANKVRMPSWLVNVVGPFCRHPSVVTRYSCDAHF